MKLIFVCAIVVVCMALTGCASLSQGYSAAAATAVKDAQLAEDNNIKTWAVDACGTPLSAIVRNSQVIPGFVPALKALCLPAGGNSQPVILFDAMPATAAH